MRVEGLGLGCGASGHEIWRGPGHGVGGGYHAVRARCVLHLASVRVELGFESLLFEKAPLSAGADGHCVALLAVLARPRACCCWQTQQHISILGNKGGKELLGQVIGPLVWHALGASLSSSSLFSMTSIMACTASGPFRGSASSPPGIPPTQPTSQGN